ncbi:MAG: AIPR family protein [Candidatus Woesearchaeota archaeon]|jgi:hypothetical protein
MTTIDERVTEIYLDFQGFPAKNSIVRNGTREDAFVLLVFETLFYNYHGIKKFERGNLEHLAILKNYIVPPPDDSIDIFFEEKDVDENHYHVVQVKNSKLQQVEIEDCFTKMHSKIDLYLKRKDLGKNLKEVISDTEFNKDYKNHISYYVIHNGDTTAVRNQKPNYYILTFEQIDLLSDASREMSVPKHVFEIDTANNFIVNNYVHSANSQKPNPDLPRSILCNLSGYDLAKLNNKYATTLFGKNILYSHNLRESLSKNSKTFDKMFDTIDSEPEFFLFYNNGLTMLSSEFDAKQNKSKETIELTNFSIINGAQTTSTLGAYLRNAEIEKDDKKINQLKKVFVLTKIFEINDSLKNSELISENIKIYNNTQTPLSSRDMVSTRKEQNMMQQKYLECDPPNIYINIKKGTSVPEYIKTYPHQKINNEVLSQLILCGFYSEPFTAKDKKAKIFENEGKDDVLLNDVYQKIYHEEEGKIFNITNVELDELLFIYRLHEDTKKLIRNNLKDQLNTINQSTYSKPDKEARTEQLVRTMDIAGVCLFYNITHYYELKKICANQIKNYSDKIFDYFQYYDNKEYKNNIIKDFNSLIYLKTVDIMRQNSGGGNINNWIRAEKNEKIFLDAVRDYLGMDFTAKDQYLGFIKKYKIV